MRVLNLGPNAQCHELCVVPRETKSEAPAREKLTIALRSVDAVLQFVDFLHLGNYDVIVVETLKP